MENLNATTAAEATAEMTDKNGNPTPKQVAAWKAAHGKIKCFTVEGMDVYFKQPTRLLVKAANTALANSKDVDAYQETILKNTQLNFIEETAGDLELYFALANKVDQIISTYSAALKNA